MSRIKDILDLFEIQKIEYDDFWWDYNQDENGNEYHIRKHENITPEEIMDAVENDKNRLIDKKSKKQLNLLCKTEGKYFRIGYTIKNIAGMKYFYPVTAYRMDANDIDYYERRGK